MNLVDKLTDEACQKIYQKPYALLGYSEKVFVNAYIRDLITPDWKPYIYHGKETAYLISNVGQVFNIKQNKKVDVTEDSNGTYVTRLKIEGKWHTFPVHRLVATLFVDNLDNVTEVIHIKDINWLNWYKNLKWISREEMVINGIGNIGKNVSNKYTEEDVNNVVTLFKKGNTIKEIAKKLNVSESFIIGVIYRGEWKSVTSKLKMPNVQTSITNDQVHDICKRLQDGETVNTIADSLEISPNIVYGIKYGKSHRFISNQYNIPGLEKDTNASEKKSDIILSLFNQGITDTDIILEKTGMENNRGNRKYISKLRQKFRKSNK